MQPVIVEFATPRKEVANEALHARCCTKWFVFQMHKWNSLHRAIVDALSYILILPAWWLLAYHW
jgi:hypothetical protein